MKRSFRSFGFVFLIIVFLSAVAFAQGGAPADTATPTTHFSVSGSAMGFSGGGQSSASTIVGGSVALTQRFSLGYEQVIVPSLDANYYLGTVNYTMPLGAMVGKTINQKLVFDTSRWSTTFFAGVGALRQTLTPTTTQHIATTVGAGLNYIANNHVTIQVVSAQWLHAAVAGPGRDVFVITPDTAAISSGLKLSF